MNELKNFLDRNWCFSQFRRRTKKWAKPNNKGAEGSLDLVRAFVDLRKAFLVFKNQNIPNKKNGTWALS